MSTNDRIRKANEQDTEQIIQLLQTCLSETRGIPRSPEFWNWKHFENPFGVSPMRVYTEDQMIVGLRAFLRWTWLAGGNPLKAVRAVDTATHPAWRGKHIFTRLTTTLLEDLTKEGVAFVFNTPNRASLPGYLRMGWKTVTRIPLWIRPVRPFNMIRRFITGPQTLSTTAATSWPEDAVLKSCVEKILEESQNEKRLHTVRTLEYLKWRYQEIPNIGYQVAHQSNDRASAIVIARTRLRKGMTELSIGEILSTSDEIGIKLGSELMQEMIKNTLADYALAIAAKGTPEEAILKRCNFRYLGKRGPVLALRKLNDFDPQLDLLNWAHWRCSIGDLEIF